MPSDPAYPVDPSAAVTRLLNSRRIAVVGISHDPSRPSHRIAQYLIRAGREVVPVNPRYAGKSVLGQPCFATLEDVPGQIDLVNVFRRSEFCADIARSDVAVNAGGLWLQSGIVSTEAAQIAHDGNVDFVQDRCIMVEIASAGG